MKKQLREMNEKSKGICGYCRCAECLRNERKAFAWKTINKAKHLAICELCFNKLITTNI